MGSDLLRIESQERIDLADFQYATDGAMQNQRRVVPDNFLTNPTGAQRTWILEGFEITNPSGQQVQVDKGRAILAQREGGQVQYGVVTGAGEANRIVDTATLTPATYGVYIRFELVDADSQSRIFWNAAGNGSEFAKTISTRRQANWSMRVESSNPGGEWTKIGEVAVPAMTITDQRPMYFEGEVHNSYESGWSSEGGGVAADRNATRAADGVHDMQKFTAAMRQCVEDIRGRGLRRWYEKGIGGMNIGFDTDPTADRIGLRTADTFWDGASGSERLQLLPTAFFRADAGTERLQLNANTFFDATPNAEALQLSTTLGIALASGIVTWTLDTDTVQAFDRGANTLTFRMDGASPIQSIDVYGGATTMRHRRANGSLATPTTVTTAQILGTNSWFGYDGTGFIEAARMQVVADNTTGTGQVPGAFRWFVADAGGGLNQQMTLDHKGHIAFGNIAAPEADVHIFASNATGASVIDAETRLLIEDNGQAWITFQGGASALQGILWASDAGGSQGQLSYDHPNEQMLFKIDGNDVMQLRKDANGVRSVMIATSPFQPQAPLHIASELGNSETIGGLSWFIQGTMVDSTSGRTGYVWELQNEFIGVGPNDYGAGVAILYPFNLAGFGAANTTADAHKALRVMSGASLVNRFWVSHEGYGYYAGKLGVGVDPTTTQVAKLRHSGSSGEFNFDASASSAFYELQFGMTNTGASIYTNSSSRRLSLGSNNIPQIECFSDNSIHVGNQAEQNEIINMGANDRYGFGINAARTIIRGHNAGQGTGIGVYNGTTFTYHMYSDAGGHWGFNVGTAPAFVASNTTVTIMSINTGHDPLNLTHARSDGLGNILICRRGNNANSGTLVFQMQSDGDLFNLNGTYATISDIRAKENIDPLPPMLDQISKLEPILYNLKDEDEEGAPQKMGFSAQQVQEVFPNLVKKGNKTDLLTSNNYGLIAPMIQSLKELKSMVEEQAAEIETLKSQLN